MCTIASECPVSCHCNLFIMSYFVSWFSQLQLQMLSWYIVSVFLYWVKNPSLPMPATPPKKHIFWLFHDFSSFFFIWNMIGFLFLCQTHCDFCFYVKSPTLVAGSDLLLTGIHVSSLPFVYSCILAWSLFFLLSLFTNHRLHVSDAPLLVFFIPTSHFLIFTFWFLSLLIPQSSFYGLLSCAFFPIIYDKSFVYGRHSY